MPSELHRIDCHCRECRPPAERRWTAEAVLSAACLAGLVLFSLGCVALVSFMTGAGQ